MSDSSQPTHPSDSRRLPLDVWAVLLALVLAALVRFGWLPAITW